jgi:hypothetical protein
MFETNSKICKTVSELKILKHEDWPGLDKISYLSDAEISTKQKMSILCGNGGMYFTEELERGADGSMTGFAFPEMLVCVIQLFKQKKKKGREIAKKREIPEKTGIWVTVGSTGSA